MAATNVEGWTCARSRAYDWKERRKAKKRFETAAQGADVNVSPCNSEEAHIPETAEMHENIEEDDNIEILIQCVRCMKRSPCAIECSGCLQGFHLNGEAGCNPLGVSPEEGKALLSLKDFRCPSCTAEKHHCHMCKKIGSCAKGNETLFMCLLSNCTLLHCSNCQRGERQSTICPIHVCSKCGSISSSDNPLIECERCSTSYHEACLPEALMSSKPSRIQHKELKMICNLHSLEEADGVQEYTKDVLELWRQSMAKELPDVFKRPYRKIRKEAGVALAPEINVAVQDGKQQRKSAGAGDLVQADDSPAGPTTPENMVHPHGRLRSGGFEVSGRRPVFADCNQDGKRKAEHLVPEPREDEMEEMLDMYDDDVIFGCGDGATEKIRSVFADELRKPRDIRKRIKVYYPHDNEPPRPVPWAKLEKLEVLNKAWENKKISEDVYRRDIMEYVRLQQTIDRYLGPMCHGERYTSFGRHFTKPDIMDKVIDQVMEYIANGDMVVDMTCGANTFVPAIKERAKERGGKVFGKAFDVILPYNSEDWERNSWFNVLHKDLCKEDEDDVDIDHLVVGINPPFGMNGNLAGKFVQKSADLQVRMMFLIVPPKTQNPHGYSVVHLDPDLCQKRSSRCGQLEKGAAFYLPSNNQESWSAVTPEFRILKRVDPEVCADLHFLGRPSHAMRTPPFIRETPPTVPMDQRAWLCQKQDKYGGSNVLLQASSIPGPEADAGFTGLQRNPMTFLRPLPPKHSRETGLQDGSNRQESPNVGVPLCSSSPCQGESETGVRIGGGGDIVFHQPGLTQLGSSAHRMVQNILSTNPKRLVVPMDENEAGAAPVLETVVQGGFNRVRTTASLDGPIVDRPNTPEGCGTIRWSSSGKKIAMSDKCSPPSLPCTKGQTFAYFTVDLKTQQVGGSNTISRFSHVRPAQLHNAPYPVAPKNPKPDVVASYQGIPLERADVSMRLPTPRMPNSLKPLTVERPHSLHHMDLGQQQWAGGASGSVLGQTLCPRREIRTVEVIEYGNESKNGQGNRLLGTGKLL